MRKAENPDFIVSADDFGKNEKINKNILQLVRLRKIDRVEVFVWGDFSSAQISQLKKSKVKIDLHLTTGDFRKERTGIFLRSLIFLTRLLGAASPKKIEADWQNQLSQFKKIFGRQPDGISSHEHIHYFPMYLKVALKLAKKHKIEFVRYGLKGTLIRNNPVSLILNFLIDSSQLNSKKTTDYLLSLDWLKKKNKILKNLSSEGTTELVCHLDRDEEYTAIKNL